MEGHSSESKKAERKTQESSPQESEVMDRYVDLQLRVYNANMTDEERKEFAQDMVDLSRKLSASEGIAQDFFKEMLSQTRALGERYLAFRKATQAAKLLERESRGGVLAPHVYENAVDLVESAIEAGVPDGPLQMAKGIITNYLEMVYQLERGIRKS